MIAEMTLIDARIGQRIRALRVAREMTQGDLAARIGVTYQQVQKYESGSSRVMSARLLRIAMALNVPVDHFFRDSIARRGPVATGPAEVPIDFTCELITRLIVRYDALPAGQKRAVLALVESLAAE